MTRAPGAVAECDVEDGGIGTVSNPKNATRSSDDDTLGFQSAADCIKEFHTRSLSPVELVDALIARIERLNPRLNALADQYLEEARVLARHAETIYTRDPDTARPLEGVPVLVKDAQRIEGKRTTFGSLIFKDAVDSYSDPMIERLLEAGAIVLARTTTPEFCISGVCRSRAWGNTLNPFNKEFGPGGSSGGSGAALAAGFAPIATGTDIGGSIRIPASCCGVVGFKPPHGRNPDGPPANFDRYNHCGPMTRTVRDAAMVQNIVSGVHPRDHDSLRERVAIPDDLPSGKGLKVAWSVDLGYRPVDGDVRTNTHKVLDIFRDMGAKVDEVDLGWSDRCDEAAMHWYGAMHFGRQIIWHAREHADLMTDYALATAKALEETGMDDAARSWDVQHEMYQSFGEIMEQYDVFICPTNTVPALKANHDTTDANFKVDGINVDPEIGWILTHHFNMLHHCPVMAVPSGFASNGVPTGIQIVGRTFDDVTVFRAAQAYEMACGGWFTADSGRPIF